MNSADFYKFIISIWLQLVHSHFSCFAVTFLQYHVFVFVELKVQRHINSYFYFIAMSIAKKYKKIKFVKNMILPSAFHLRKKKERKIAMYLDKIYVIISSMIFVTFTSIVIKQNLKNLGFPHVVCKRRTSIIQEPAWLLSLIVGSY